MPKTNIKSRFQGLHFYRYEQNPLEEKFAIAWQREEQGLSRHTLEYLLGDGQSTETPSSRDEKVAATVVQWLGSPVGQNFLLQVLTKDAQFVKRFLEEVSIRDTKRPASSAKG